MWAEPRAKFVIYYCMLINNYNQMTVEHVNDIINTLHDNETIYYYCMSLQVYLQSLIKYVVWRKFVTRPDILLNGKKIIS